MKRTGCTLLLALVLLCFVSCEDRRQQSPDLVAIPVEKWSEDSSYSTVAGQPALLLGFDLRTDTFDFVRWRDVVKTIGKSGGNYLRIDTSGIASDELVQLYEIASGAGVVLDTGNAIDGTALSVASSVNQFNRYLLAGSRGAVFTEYDQRKLNALRGLRTVHRRMPMWTLSMDTSILGDLNYSAVTAAGNGRGSYLIYAATVGRINLTLDAEQVPRRVSVVGHLGTQRSEILRPPYDRHFSLLSNEERGGWILIEPLTIGKPGDK